MINLNVYCHPTFIFTDGDVKGYIEIAPRALIDAAILELYHVGYKSPEANSIRLLIVAEESKFPDKKMICITSGTISKDYVQISMHDSIDLLGDYIRIDKLIDDDSLSSDKKMYIKDFLDVRDYIYRCDDCNCRADTANINYK